MKKWSGIVVLVLGLIVAGCGSQHNSASPNNTTNGTSPRSNSQTTIPGGTVTAGDIELNQSSSGSTVKMAKGQFLRISLPSNPSTGFSWVSAGEPDSAVLVGQGREFTPAPHSKGEVGYGGTERLSFQAVGGGSTVIRLVYERPWEHASPAKTFSVRVTVAQ